jgi:hypothetical protein
MHRIAFLFLSLVLVFAVSACESETSDENNTADTTTAGDTTETADTTVAGDTVNADVNVGPAPCSPEAQGLSGDAVAFSVVPIPAGCEWLSDDMDSNTYAEPSFSFMGSEEEVMALFNCDGATPPLGVDFSANRLALVEGVHEHSSDAPYINWVIESDGNLVVDITFEAYCSGIAPANIRYQTMVALPLGDAPVSGQLCYLPADDICGMLP